jgi:hypothetical protein
MPLVTCPDCQHQISDTAPLCVHCGRPASAEIDLRCPRCGSDQTQSVSVAYAQGTSSFAGAERGLWAYASGDVAVGGERFRGASHTTLAQTLAPPQYRTYRSVFGLAVVVWLATWVVLAALDVEWQAAPLSTIGALVALVAAYRPIARWNNRDCPRLRAEWERKFFCYRCGHIFAATTHPDDAVKRARGLRAALERTSSAR